MPDNVENNAQSIPVTEQNIRTASDVAATDRELRDSHFRPLTMWFVLFGVFAVISVISSFWGGLSFSIFVAAFFAIRAYAMYRANGYANLMTLGVPYTPQKLDGTSTARGISISLSKRYDLEPPKFRYSGNSFSGMYDPNENEVTLGTYYACYESDAALATAVHETAHHIIINDPSNNRWHRHLLELASMCQMLSFVFAISYVALVLLAPLSPMMSVMFKAFLIAMLLNKAIITTHEYTVNSFVKQLMFSDLEEISQIKDRERAFKSLKLGERTYSVDLAGWIVIAVFLSVLIPF